MVIKKKTILYNGIKELKIFIHLIVINVILSYIKIFKGGVTLIKEINFS